MALINCPECGKQISDKASSCPNCGFPIALQRDNKIQESSTLKEATDSYNISTKRNNKKAVLIAVAFASIIIVALVAVIIKNSISHKNAQVKREQQIQDVEIALDNIDRELNELFIELEPEEPFLYGDSVSDFHKAKIKGILDNITDNQRIVEDAYENEDREFIKEIDDYISTNKTYRSWDEYNSEIKKLYGNSISNDQAADNLVKEIASSEEEYRDFKNQYFVMKSLNNSEFVEYDMNYDPEHNCTKTVTGYLYSVDVPVVVYEGYGHPKGFVAKFKLLGSSGQVIGEQEWDMSAQNPESSSSVVFADHYKRITFDEVKTQGMNHGDSFIISLDSFHSDNKENPTALIMEVISVIE